MISKKEYEYLLPQENHLRTSRHDYIVGVTSEDVDYCKVLYNKLGYEGPCKVCKYDVKEMYKILSNLFYEYREYQQQKADKPRRKRANSSCKEEHEGSDA